MKYISFAILSVLMFCQCAAKSEPIDLKPFKPGQPERLYAAHTVDSQLVISVTSTGCTKAGDFVVETRRGAAKCEIEIYRLKPDLCKRAAFVLELSLPWNEYEYCQDKTLEFVNEFQVERTPSQNK